jgi:hypothetical protein
MSMPVQDEFSSHTTSHACLAFAGMHLLYEQQGFPIEKTQGPSFPLETHCVLPKDTL